MFERHRRELSVRFEGAGQPLASGGVRHGLPVLLGARPARLNSPAATVRAIGPSVTNRRGGPSSKSWPRGRSRLAVWRGDLSDRAAQRGKHQWTVAKGEVTALAPICHQNAPFNITPQKNKTLHSGGFCTSALPTDYFTAIALPSAVFMPFQEASISFTVASGRGT